jgi:acyl CoA:acetate/3-ketoacid CoA transferase beta subunit
MRSCMVLPAPAPWHERSTPGRTRASSPSVRVASLAALSHVKRCTLPLTSERSVDLVVTELAVIGFENGRASLLETAPGVSVQQVLEATEAQLVVRGEVPTMQL